MGIKYRKEDEADRWLREHDPYYSSHNGHKSKLVTRSYDTLRMERTKAETEIPFSNLNSSQMRCMRGVAGTYNENGEFEL